MITPVRLWFPAGKHLVSVARDGQDVLVELGDMTSIVSRMPWTPVMSVTPLRYLAGRRFVATRVARHWAGDMESTHREQARMLVRLLDWAEQQVREGRTHAAA